MKPAKALFFIGALLLVYGYLCRIMKIYFFWDSKTIGFIVLLIALLAYLFELHKSRKLRGKKTVWVKIGIGFLGLGLFTIPVAVMMFKTSDAYQAAIDYIQSNDTIKKEVGTIRGFGLIPTGEMQSSSFNGVETGQAIFHLTIRGDKRYRDVAITLQKTAEVDWTVISVE